MTEVPGTVGGQGDEATPEDCWANEPRDVFVLGAGFSIAVASVFPRTDELGDRAIARLREQSRLDRDDHRVPTDSFCQGRFEAWLARLAEDQPYLSTADNLKNRALFVEVSQALRDVLVECEESVDHLSTSCLFDLVSVWHARQAQIITLNYDTLIERNVANHLLTDPAARQQITSRHILDDLPAAPTEEGILAGKGLGTLRLLKLHGSTSWYWVPNDTTGSTIQRWDPPLTEPRSGLIAEAERRRLLPGRAPFIVPPTSTKAGFYDNPLTREIWTRAYEAIRQADRLFLVGYSFPVTDVSVSGLIVDALGNRPNRAEVHIVDLQPEPVRTRLETMGITPITEEGEGEGEGEEDRVEHFVAKYVDEASGHVVEHLQAWNPGSTPGAVRVAWGTEHGRFAINWILDMGREGGSRTVVVRVVGPDEAPSTAVPMLLGRFLNLLDGADRIVLDADGMQSTIVDCRARPQLRGADGTIDSWHLDLIPAGMPPSGWIRSSPVSHLGQFPGKAAWQAF